MLVTLISVLLETFILSLTGNMYCFDIANTGNTLSSLHHVMTLH